MTNVGFLHGFNTPGAAYDITFGQSRSALMLRRPDILLTPGRWGDDLGAALKANGASILRYDQARAVDKLRIEQLDENELWELLDQDPVLGSATW